MAMLDRIVEVAVSAARRAGAVQKDAYVRERRVDARLAHDIKLEVDRLCERAIIDEIRASFPSHAVLSEECGEMGGEEYVWHIDPLDGTVNFYYGLPYFCTTLACYRKAGAGSPDGLGEPLVGVTYAPLHDELFVGVVGSGTTLNGVTVFPRDEAALSETYLITSFGGYRKKVDFTREVVLRLTLDVRKTRDMGACALDLAYVAAGRASATIQYGVNPWDVAAGRVLVEAAGGAFSSRDLGDGQLLVWASGKTIHDELTARLSRY